MAPISYCHDPKWWAYHWWLDDMYLAQPLCLPVNVNPGMLFPPQNIKSNNDIALLAARVIANAYHWWLYDMYLAQPLCLPVNVNPGMLFPPQNIKSNKTSLCWQLAKALPVERATSREKGQPLCMAQFYRLLTSYRAPGNLKDSLYNTEPDSPAPRQHVIIGCRNQFYALHLKTKDRSEVLTEEEIASSIMSILNSPATITTPPVGILTTQRRDIWAESRDLLRQGTHL
ncbi:hypothetical protein LSTR_LSTR009306 [Laodelphax striatellus]|uniref:Choline/carnitine acyltransferase domain-containing protein n=1 Tax=Laodelphax striatellus TaxID=195883 RepID=A0A482XSX9_LAOST|nr:hypothetical protein LSTR_LSTR009306 [Laodelphax striatellus]